MLCFTHLSSQVENKRHKGKVTGGTFQSSAAASEVKFLPSSEGVLIEKWKNFPFLAEL